MCFARKKFGFSELEVLRKLLGLAVFFEELSARRYEFLRTFLHGSPFKA